MSGFASASHELDDGNQFPSTSWMTALTLEERDAAAAGIVAVVGWHRPGSPDRVRDSGQHIYVAQSAAVPGGSIRLFSRGG
jgi:hypothetical protein